MTLLARGRTLRGSVLDPFGYTAERRMERRLITDYKQLIDGLLTTLDRDNHAQAVRIAKMALEVRGFGHVKGKTVCPLSD